MPLSTLTKLLQRMEAVFARQQFAVEWKTGPTENFSFVAKLPSSVLFSTYVAQLDRRVDIAALLAKLGVAVNHQRYDQALGMDQVQMGLWNTAIHSYAR